jgi:hypothetical protein
VTALTVSPGSVDVRSKSGTLTFTATVSDTVPMSAVQLDVTSPFVKSRVTLAATFSRTGGTGTTSVWTAKLVIPRYSQDGTWKIADLRGEDVGGGSFDYSTDFSNGGNWDNSWPQTFAVVSKNDLSAPSVTSLTLSHPSVNTSTRAQTLIATVKAGDNLAGVKQIVVSGQMPAHGHYYGTRGGTLTIANPVTATRTHAISLVVPKAAGYGTHTWVLTLTAVDNVGNKLTLTGSALLSHHLTSTFKVVSVTDFTPPRLTGLSFSSTSIDARTADQHVTVTLKASDALAGVQDAGVGFTTPWGSNVAVRPTGPAGTGVTWHATLTIPQCGDNGTWTVSGVSLVDATSGFPEAPGGNAVTLTTAQVSDLGFPTTLTVQSIDAQPPTATMPGTVAAAGPIVVTFDEPTLWKGSDNPFYVLDTTGSATAVPGTWTCKNAGSTTVGCNDDGADVVTASFQPTTAFTVGHSIEVGVRQDVPADGIYDVHGNGPLVFGGHVTAT